MDCLHDRPRELVQCGEFVDKRRNQTGPGVANKCEAKPALVGQRPLAELSQLIVQLESLVESAMIEGGLSVLIGAKVGICRPFHQLRPPHLQAAAPNFLNGTVNQAMVLGDKEFRLWPRVRYFRRTAEGREKRQRRHASILLIAWTRGLSRALDEKYLGSGPLVWSLRRGRNSVFFRRNPASN